MGDLFVHVRMKECCRGTLKDLDKRKKKAKVASGLLSIPSLFEALGDKPIDEAWKALPSGSAGGSARRGAVEGELEQLTRSMCEKICTKHADEHGDTTEGRFWKAAALAVMDKLPEGTAPGTGAAGPVGAAGGKEKSGKALKAAADEALKKHGSNCSGSTAAVAEALGHEELSGLNANEQVDYMAKNWNSVDAETAKALAEQGELVVAGKTGKSHGHTAVIVPGPGTMKNDGGAKTFYPNVQGGALGGPGSGGYSDGTKTAGDVWNKSDRTEVTYYTPK
jgi:hypothetical protein